MLRGKLVNMANVNTIVETFVNDKRFKETYQLMPEGEHGFQFWNDWNLVTVSREETPTRQEIENDLREMISNVDKDFQVSKKEFMDGDKFYFTFTVHRDVRGVNEYFSMTVTLRKGLKPEINICENCANVWLPIYDEVTKELHNRNLV